MELYTPKYLTTTTKKMTTPFQQKLKGIFLAGDSLENLINTAGGIFSKAINNNFQNLIPLFNEKFPPEECYEQIHRWTQGTTPYLIGAKSYLIGATPYLIGAKSYLIGAKPYLIGAKSYLIGAKSYLIGAKPYLIGAKSYLIGAKSYLIGAKSYLIGATPYLIGACVLICCGSVLITCLGRSGGKMMKAPGRPYMKISRGAFEGNPRGYFRDLRGKSNN